MTEAHVLERAYDFVSGDAEERACADIPESACSDLPRNFFLNAANGAATKLAERIAGPDLVLAWLLAAVGAPSFLTGFLMPVRRGGSLLPQLAVAGHIRGRPTRKRYWVGAGLTQAAALGLMIPAVLALSGAAAGVVVIALLAVFSLASGVGSVAYKDVLAKTVPRGRRGRLLALRATLGGALALGAGLALKFGPGKEAALGVYAALLGGAAALWLCAAGIFAAIHEAPGATEGGRNALAEARAGRRLLREVPGFRRFVLARAVLVSVQLSLPFYALFARRVTGAGTGGLGFMLIAAALAQIVSNPVWGRFADADSRRVMTGAALLAAVAGGAALVLDAVPGLGASPIPFAGVFLLVGVAQAGVRLGRKTYLVDGAPAGDRPLYVALSNTVAGVVTLAGAVLGGVESLLGIRVLVAVLIALALAGAWAAARLPEVERLAEAG